MLSEIIQSVSVANCDGHRQLIVDRLEWNTSNYNNCSQFIFESEGMTVFSYIYLSTHDERRPKTETPAVPLSFELFPLELIETLFVGAAMKLFVLFNMAVPRAQIYALASLCSVSRFWWRTLTNRKYVRCLLRRCFRRVTFPFKCSPEQLPDLCTGRLGRGVAECRGKLYVASQGHDTIQVFKIHRSPFNRHADIKIQGLTFFCSDHKLINFAHFFSPLTY
jgi:hypothetical protein